MSETLVLFYDYDKLNNLLDKSYEDAKGKETDKKVNYTYDKYGERVSMKDAIGKSSYEYDELGRISKAVNGSGKAVSYLYNEADSLQEIIYPDGTKVSYEYDLNDNLIKVTDRKGTATQYKYDALNRVTETIRPNGTKTTVTYDAQDHVTKLVNECTVCKVVISSYEYQYNAQGYIVSESASELEASSRKEPNWADWYRPDGQKQADDKKCNHQEKTVKTSRTYKYDDNWELTRCTEKVEGGKTTVHNYTYDKVGNRKTYEKIEDGLQKVKYQYEYNDSNQLVKKKNCRIWGDTGVRYQYDEDGNLIKKNENSYDQPVQYEYTAENRLAVVKQGSTVLMAALYDGDGNRVFEIDNTYKWEDCYGDDVLIPKSQRTENGDSPKEELAKLAAKGADAKGYTLTEYINDTNQEDTQVLAEYSADDTIRQAYTYGDTRVSVDKTDKTSYYLNDGRGSVTGLVTQDDSLTNSYRYDAYGDLISGTPDAVNYYGYNAESTNTKTGFQYLRARYYDPANGTFTTEDTEDGTKENPLTRNRFAYVLNNPENYNDPSGKFWKELWNGAKKAVKKAGNWVNKHIIQPVKKAVNKAISWVKKTAGKVVNTVKGWFSGGSSSGGGRSSSGGSRNHMGYVYDSTGGYTGSMSSYRNLSPNEKASYMSDADLGAMSNGKGLTGKQLERYQKQRAKMKREQMKREACKADQKKAKADWKEILKGGLKVVGMLMPDIVKMSKPVSDIPGPAGAAGSNVSVTYKGSAQDALQLGAGIAEMIGGFMGAAGGTLGAPVSGGTSAVAVPGSIALAGAGAVTAGAALNNMFDVNISQSNTNGGGKGGSEAEQLKKLGSNSKANDIAGKFGFDSAEDFKEAFVGKTAIKKFNMKYNPKTKEIVLEAIKGGAQVHTGYYID